ncbi:hypothetical protein QBC43DRAFT_132743 [Cladorrhinum sp. PSN259]|nr:hypothetical protein QBC43DRAFT_132743 [Cladorrhinum sp. PSN259]
MGNLCGKASSDNFNQPGRRLDSAPPPHPASASVPASASARPKQSPKVGGPPRTLGGGSAPSSPSSSADDPRKKAGEAAAARLERQKEGGGKLKAQLDKERAKTRVGTLKDLSEAERRHRDVDQSADALRNT